MNMVALQEDSITRLFLVHTNRVEKDTKKRYKKTIGLDTMFPCEMRGGEGEIFVTL
jgi:hypothetical protein